ncbi:MAG TPA: hypothetical protein VNU27_04990 [Candidatus Acidoferrum sp.]|nr:hypothetical protein [Candidatus Acidoferrum sp.]
MSISSVQIRHARLIVIAMTLVAAAAILLLTHSYTFYFDEWTFILTAPDWTWITYLQPHNEHPVMLPRLIYAALLSTVGLRSYLPYMAVLLALHATSAVLLFEIVRRRAGDLVAIGCAALFLVLGAAWENLLWAFQITFVGSVACGLGMLLALEGPSTPRRLLAAALLLAGALAFSAMGIAFAAGAAVTLVVTPARRRDLLWLAPVIVLFGVWYLALGRGGTPPNPPPRASNVLLVPLFVAWGLGQSAAGLVGESGPWGPPALVLAASAVAVAWWRRRPDALALGVLGALLAVYVVTGLGRVQLGVQQAGAGRYVYEGAALWLILLADVARNLPWRGTWRPALAACLFLACFSSAVLLFSFAAAKSVQMQREVADLQALAFERSDPCLSADGTADALVMPQVNDPATYYRATDRYGDPVAGLPVTDQADFDRARRNLVRAGCN